MDDCAVFMCGNIEIEMYYLLYLGRTQMVVPGGVTAFKEVQRLLSKWLHKEGFNKPRRKWMR